MKISTLIDENKNFIKEAFLYGIIGLFSASLDAGVYYILRKYFLLNMIFSNFISINLGIFFSFMMNRTFTFKKKDNIIQRGASFFFIGYIGLFVSLAIFYLGKKVINSEMTIKFFSIIVVALIQFILNKFFTFKK